MLEYDTVKKYTRDNEIMDMLMESRNDLDPEVLKFDGKKQSLDVVLAFDTTKSMTPFIRHVREGIEYVIGNINAMMVGRIGLMGVSDFHDEKGTVPKDKIDVIQIKPFTSDPKQLRAYLQEIGDERKYSNPDAPEAYEFLWREMNGMSYDNPFSVIMIGDSVPHGMADWNKLVRGRGPDRGVLQGVEYKQELAQLKKRAKGFYFLSVEKHEGVNALQMQLVEHGKFYRQLSNPKDIYNFIVAAAACDAGTEEQIVKAVDPGKYRQMQEERPVDIMQALISGQ